MFCSAPERVVSGDLRLVTSETVTRDAAIFGSILNHADRVAGDLPTRLMLLEDSLRQYGRMDNRRRYGFHINHVAPVLCDKRIRV
jgi:hypothetical protein